MYGCGTLAHRYGTTLASSVVDLDGLAPLSGIGGMGISTSSKPRRLLHYYVMELCGASVSGVHAHTLN